MEAARRAISSPLLEGASVNGSRGVIINVTGGPDLSLVEVSEAASIVQEAADEEANIIFGAVVDPALKGKVKITVIATGFGAAAATRTPSAPPQTPIDLSAYVEQPRLRAEPTAPAATTSTAQSSRFLLNRRSPFELPLSPAPVPAIAPVPLDVPMAVPRPAEAAMEGELNSPLDIPAFLRRQEG